MVQVNLDLEIFGDLVWQFWFFLGVSLGCIEVCIVGEEDLFVGINSVSVGVVVWLLLFGQVEMDGVILDGLEVNLVEIVDGVNWEKIGLQDGVEEEIIFVEEEQFGESGGMDILLIIFSVVIIDGKICYWNIIDGIDICVEYFNFNVQDVSLEELFLMQMLLCYQDQSDMCVDLNLEIILVVDLENNYFVFDLMILDVDIVGMIINLVSVYFEQKLDVNLDEDWVQVIDLLLEVVGICIIGNVIVIGLIGEMKVVGQINIELFDVNKVLEVIGEEFIVICDDNVFSKVVLSVILDGLVNSVMVNLFKVILDSSILIGIVGLENLESGKIVFDLNLDKIILDGYLLL